MQAVTGRISLTVLLETLEDASTMGAEDSDLKHRLQERADRAQALEQQAAACLTPIHDASSGGARVDLAELEAMMQEGHSIGIKMDSLTELAAFVSAAKAWDQQAAFCLTGQEAQHAKHGKVQTPSLATVTELLQQHASLAVAVPHAQALLEKQQQAVSWVDSAVRALEHCNLQQHLPDVQAIVDSGLALNLEMPELTQLDSLVRAIQWNDRVRRAFGLPQPTLAKHGVTESPVKQSQHVGAEETGKQAATSVIQQEPLAADTSAEPMDSTGAQQTRMEPTQAGQMLAADTSTQPAQAVADQAESAETLAPAGPAELPAQHATSNHAEQATPQSATTSAQQIDAQPGHESQTLHRQPDQPNHVSQAVPHLANQPDAKRQVVHELPEASWHERVTLAEAEQLVEQGQQLPVEEALLHQLHTLTQIGQHWQVQVIGQTSREIIFTKLPASHTAGWRLVCTSILSHQLRQGLPDDLMAQP